MNKSLEPTTRDPPINECIWYRSETMNQVGSTDCMSCGGYRRECAESGKYFPREDKMKMQEFVENFVRRWNSRNDRGYKYKKDFKEK